MTKPAKMEIDRDGYWLDCDYMSGACYSHENSQRHFKYADLAAIERDYGFAVSHLVLGVEEIIKALLLVCLYRNRYFLSTDEKEDIFSKHNFKHVNIKELFSSLLPERIEAYHENPFAFMDSGKGNKFQTAAHFLCKGLKLGHLDPKEVKTLVNLMNHANDYKNKGFYVDYRFDWKLPENINAKTYNNYKKVSARLQEYINPIFTMPLYDDRLQDFLDGSWI